MYAQGKCEAQQQFYGNSQHNKHACSSQCRRIVWIVKDDAKVACTDKFNQSAAEFCICKAEINNIEEGEYVEEDQEDQCWGNKAVFDGLVLHGLNADNSWV